MNLIPLIPLPHFFGETAMRMHNEGSIMMAIGMAFFGTFILALWVPGYRNFESSSTRVIARERIRMGILLYGLALGSLIFGLYLIATMFGAIATYLLYCIFRGIVIAFSRENGNINP
jgi:hypothetical protein